MAVLCTFISITVYIIKKNGAELLEAVQTFVQLRTWLKIDLSMLIDFQSTNSFFLQLIINYTEMEKLKRRVALLNYKKLPFHRNKLLIPVSLIHNFEGKDL